MSDYCVKYKLPLMNNFVILKKGTLLECTKYLTAQTRHLFPQPTVQSLMEHGYLIELCEAQQHIKQIESVTA